MGTLVLLGILFWMAWFTWFPDVDRLCRLALQEVPAPAEPEEIWAMQLYRETFAPDCGARWMQRGVVWLSWLSWLCLLSIAILDALFAAEVLPRFLDASLAALLLLFALGQTFLLLFLGSETVLQVRKGIPLSYRARRDRWLANHPAPEQMARRDGRQPWWFWLDSRFADTLIRVLVFLGGFTASVLVALYAFHLEAPGIFTVGRFWNLVFCWILVVLWLPVPLTLWLSSLDWTHRDREVLLLWAEKQAKRYSVS